MIFPQKRRREAVKYRRMLKRDLQLTVNPVFSKNYMHEILYQEFSKQEIMISFLNEIMRLDTEHLFRRFTSEH
jgi:hypothetical protein